MLTLRFCAYLPVHLWTNTSAAHVSQHWIIQSFCDWFLKMQHLAYTQNLK